MRISDWSSDVCSSDLDPEAPFSDAELLQKFHQLADPVLGAARAGSVAAGCLAIAGTAELAAFTALVLAAAPNGLPAVRSAEARRVGKECVSTCSIRWSP